MRLLAVDTCLSACTAVVARDGVVLAALSEPMTRGHQERLAPLVAEVMAAADVAFADLDRVAATVGPGSFTGLRVGLSFARGLALARAIPCAGIGTLEALAWGAEGRAAALIDARRGQAYWQAFGDGRPLTAPAIAAVEDIATALARLSPGRITGPGAALMEGRLAAAALHPAEAPSPEALASLAAREPAPAPAPLYLRAPDAKLPGGRDLER